MKKFLLTASILSLLVLNALALPGLEIAIGPYVGLYNPSLKTLDEQVFLWNHQTGMGSALIYGGQIKIGLPMGIGGGLDMGYWKNTKEWTDITTAGTTVNNYKISLMPLDVFAQYSMPIVPMVLKAKLGASVGNIWAKYDRNQTLINQWVHYWKAEGSTSTFGVYGGLDLVALPKFNVSAEIGYKMGKVDQLLLRNAMSRTISMIFWNITTTTKSNNCHCL